MSKTFPKKDLKVNSRPVPSSLKICRGLMGLLHVVCPLLFFTNLTRNPYYTQIALLNIGISLCALTYVAYYWRQKEYRIPSFPFQWPLLVFLILALLSSAFSWFSHPLLRSGIFSESVRVWVFTVINCVFVIYLSAVLTPSLAEKSETISIWIDIFLACVWGSLWLGFHQMRDPGGSLLWDTYGGFLWILGSLYAVLRTKRGDAESIFHVLFAVALLAGVYGIFQYWGRDMIWASPVQPYGGRPVSSFGNPNFLSSYLMMISPLAFGFGVVSAGRHRYGYWFIALVTAMGVLCTLTRSTYVGLFAAYGTLGAITFRREHLSSLKPIAVGLFVFVLLILIFPSTPLSNVQSPLARFTEIFSAHKSGASYGPWDQRILIWSSAWEMLRGNFLLGKGWGCFELFYPFFQGHFILIERLAIWRTHANNAHNILLEMWSQTGFLGTGASLWLMATIVVGGWFSYRRQQHQSKGVIYAAMVAAVVGMIADNFFGNVSIFFAVPAFLFWWVAGMMFNQNEHKLTSEFPTLSAINRVLLVVVAVVSLGSSVYYFSRWKQEVLYFQGFKEAKGNAVLPSIKSLERAFSWFGREVNTNYELGNSYSRYARELADRGLETESRKYTEKAATAYQDAINANPGYDEIYFNLGVILYQLGRTEEAEKNMEMCIFINPLFHDAYGSLGNHYINAAKMEKAVGLLERGVEIFPKDKDLWNNLGYCYSQVKNDEKSFEAYKKAILIDPGFRQAWHNLGVAAMALKRRDPILEVPAHIKDMETHLAQKNYKAALVPAKKIVEALPENADAHLSLGNIYFYVGEKSESEKQYLKAIELNPRFSIAFTNLGRLYQVDGKIDNAVQFFQKALSVDPGNAEAKKALSELQR